MLTFVEGSQSKLGVRCCFNIVMFIVSRHREILQRWLVVNQVGNRLPDFLFFGLVKTIKFSETIKSMNTCCSLPKSKQKSNLYMGGGPSWAPLARQKSPETS